MSIYLNSASHGLTSRATRERIIRHLTLESDRGEAVAAEMVRDELVGVRQDLARLLGAGPDEVGFQTTASAAWLAVVSHIPMRGKRVLVAPHEWGDNLRHLARMSKEMGFTLETLPPLAADGSTMSAWAARIDSDVAAIFCPMISSVSGQIYPVAQIGRLPRPDGCLFVVDAAQALGQRAVDVGAIGCDALVATSRKWLRGPRWTACYWVNPRLMAARMLEPADKNVALLLGLGVAQQEALAQGGDALGAQINALALHGFDAARQLGLAAHCSSRPASGMLNLTFNADEKRAVIQALAAAQIEVKFTNPAAEEPYAAEFAPSQAVLRISANTYNTPAEMDLAVAKIAAALGRG